MRLPRNSKLLHQQISKVAWWCSGHCCSFTVPGPLCFACFPTVLIFLSVCVYVVLQLCAQCSQNRLWINHNLDQDKAVIEDEVKKLQYVVQ